MLSYPGIATFTMHRPTHIQCSACGLNVYEMKPYEAVYPRGSVGRAMGQTKIVKGECKCGCAYQFPVTQTV